MEPISSSSPMPGNAPKVPPPSLGLILFGALFGGLGLLFTVFILKDVSRTLSLVQAGSLAQGTVIRMDSRHGENGTTYAPVVSFVAADGISYTFISNSSSNPPGFATGEKVEVLYLPDRPSEARINTFFQLWGVAVIGGVLCPVFIVIGAGLAVFTIRQHFIRKRLLVTGQRIQAKIIDVEYRNTRNRRNRNSQSFWVVKAQWLRPNTNTIHVFESDHLNFDPADYLKGETVEVFINPQKPKHYWMPLASLPSIR